MSDILPPVSKRTLAPWRLFGLCSSPFSKLILLMHLGVIVSATTVYLKDYRSLVVGNSMEEIFGYLERRLQDAGTGYLVFNVSDGHSNRCLARISSDLSAVRFEEPLGCYSQTSLHIANDLDVSLKLVQMNDVKKSLFTGVRV